LLSIIRKGRKSISDNGKKIRIREYQGKKIGIERIRLIKG